VECSLSIHWYKLSLSKMNFVIDFGMLILYTMYCRSTREMQGRLAQLGEHLPYKQGVIGSSPIVPTKEEVEVRCGRLETSIRFLTDHDPLQCLAR
jgi:hypothetical protein